MQATAGPTMARGLSALAEPDYRRMEERVGRISIAGSLQLAAMPAGRQCDALADRRDKCWSAWPHDEHPAGRTEQRQFDGRAQQAPVVATA